MKVYWILICALLLTNKLQAQFTFFTEDETVTITGYTGTDPNMVIPSTINGYPVVYISFNAFADNSTIVSASIPNSVTNIESQAFLFCSGLTNVIIPDSVTIIGIAAFYGCSGLTSVNIPNGMTRVDNGVFSSCSGLTSVNIPESVTYIGDSAFSSCSSLSSITIPKNVIKIQESAFYGCSAVTDITLPAGVTFIGQFAFNACSGVTRITIPDSVTNIGDEAFGNCPNLTNFFVGTLNTSYSSSDGVLFNRAKTTLIQYPSAKTNSSYAVPNGITVIADSACNSCTSLKTAIIPESVTSIGFAAFAESRILDAIYFKGNPPTLLYAGGYAFDAISPSAKFYYLPGSTGWAASYGGNFYDGGRPTVLWNPQAQTSDGSFGISTNGFGFNITGTSDLTVVVEAATSLDNPVWTALSTNTLTNGTSYFSDAQWTNFPSRLYRIRSP